MEILKQEIIQLPMPKSESGKERKKIALFAQVKMKMFDFKFNFIVVHLKSKVKFVDVRTAQFEELTKFLTKMEDIPSIISGDFNADPVEPAIQSACQMGYHSVMPTMGNGLYSTAKLRVEPKLGKTAKVIRLIDYIFYRNQSSSTGLKLHPRCYLQPPMFVDLGEKLLPNAACPSDHLDLVADFDLIE